MLKILHKNAFKSNKKISSILYGNIQKYSTEKNDLPAQADVVVIGGGVIGCNIFYQLSKKGVKAVLLERAKLTSGTTWHTAGTLWRLRPSDVDVQLLGATRNFLLNLENEVETSAAFTMNGGLFISRTEERLKEYKRLNTLGKLFGIESHILSSEEAVQLHPLLDPKNFNAALYSPGDGSIDPSIYCAAMTKGAKKLGGTVVENCPVTSISVDESTGYRKISGVTTPLGSIKTRNIVNACGAWSRNISQMVGLDIPLVAMKHAYVVTDSIPGVKGAPNIRDHDGSIYYRTQGDTLCLGGYEPNPEILKEVASDFHFGLYDLDFSIFGLHIERAAELTPVFKTVGIKTNICGPESFTPDHKPIFGEDPRLGGLYYACGLNSLGMMLSAGCAEQLATWIIKGRPDLPMYAYDIRRFTTPMRTNRAWATETSHESYVKNYSIVYRYDQPNSGRNMKIDVFHEVLVANGAVMEQGQGWERPAYFIKDSTAPVRTYDWYGHYDHVVNTDQRYAKELEGDCTFEFSKHHDLIGEEALAARTNAALFDMSYFCKMYLTGPDAQEAADWLFTSHTDQKLEKVVYSCILNAAGGVEGNVTVTGLNQGLGTLVGPILKGKGYYIVAGGASGYHTLCHLRKEIEKKKFKAVVTDVTDKLGILSIQGPKSSEILQSITESPITDEAFPVGMSDLITINGHLCRAMRVSFVGELGYELHIPYASCIPIYHKVEEAGRSFGMRFAGFRALYSLSCEKGYHLWNYDLRNDDNPVEANLSKTCREEGSYLGKRHVEKLKKEGVKKVRVFFTLKDRVPLNGLEIIWRDDVVVGLLRRGEYGYSLDCPIGIGYVSHPEGNVVNEKFLTSGSYEIESMGIRYPALLHLQSPFDPKTKRTVGFYEHHFQEHSHIED